MLSKVSRSSTRSNLISYILIKSVLAVIIIGIIGGMGPKIKDSTTEELNTDNHQEHIDLTTNKTNELDSILNSDAKTMQEKLNKWIINFGKDIGVDIHL